MSDFRAQLLLLVVAVIRRRSRPARPLASAGHCGCGCPTCSVPGNQRPADARPVDLVTRDEWALAGGW